MAEKYESIFIDDEHDLLAQLSECPVVQTLILESTGLTDKGTIDSSLKNYHKLAILKDETLNTSYAVKYKLNVCL